MSENGRRHPRRRVNLWSVQWAGDARYYRPIHNLSTSGLFTYTDVTFPVGTELKIEIKLPDRVVEVRAVVVHERGGNGIEFRDVSADDQDALARFLSNC